MKGNNQKTWAILQKRHEMFKRTTRHEKQLKKGKNYVIEGYISNAYFRDLSSRNSLLNFQLKKMLGF